MTGDEYTVTVDYTYEEYSEFIAKRFSHIEGQFAPHVLAFTVTMHQKWATHGWDIDVMGNLSMSVRAYGFETLGYSGGSTGSPGHSKKLFYFRFREKEEAMLVKLALAS